MVREGGNERRRGVEVFGEKVKIGSEEERKIRLFGEEGKV